MRLLTNLSCESVGSASASGRSGRIKMSKLSCPKLVLTEAPITIVMAVLSNGSLQDFKELHTELELETAMDEIVGASCYTCRRKAVITQSFETGSSFDVALSHQKLW